MGVMHPFPMPGTESERVRRVSRGESTQSPEARGGRRAAGPQARRPQTADGAERAEFEVRWAARGKKKAQPRTFTRWPSQKHPPLCKHTPCVLSLTKPPSYNAKVRPRGHCACEASGEFADGRCLCASRFLALGHCPGCCTTHRRHVGNGARLLNGLRAR